MKVSAFVLAGGRSSRMGVDKALLQVGDESFLSLALQNARQVCDSPAIVGDAARYATFGPVIEDRMRGCGPLGGIHAALSVTRVELNLILSVDLPLMRGNFLRWLVNQASSGEQLATVPRWNGRAQPLCAVYRRGILPVVEKELCSGRYKIDALFGDVPTRLVAETEICGAGFDGEIFQNVNTPEDYEWVKAHSAQVGVSLVKGVEK